MNPQRRGRILLKFVDLVNEHLDELAALLSSEHGKTLPDAKGDIQRGIEVVEFSAGAPHLLKGEFSDDAGSGIDVHSMRQPLGVVAGITPFNFPAMIPLWKSGPALAAGNAFILKPSERDPSVPLRLAELFTEAGRAGRRLQRGQRGQGSGGRPARGSSASRPSALWAPPRSPSTSTPPRPPTASAPSASAGPRTTW